MKDKWKQWINEKGMEKWFRRDNLILLVLGGILLFIIALPTGTLREDNDRVSGEETGDVWGYDGGEDKSMGAKNTDTAENGLPGADITTPAFLEEDYLTGLEQRLKSLLSGMSGVGEVQVMITLSSSRELVVEKDQPYSRSQTNETDDQGGMRVITRTETQPTTVYRTEEGGSEPYVIKSLVPRVEGVVVVAQGAGTGATNKNITEVVQALFDLEAHKIKVVKMEGTN